MITEDTHVTLVCGKCGIEFAVPNHWQEKRLESGESFWCPNGHERVFNPTRVDSLKAALNAEKEKVAAVLRGQCPQCRRTFKNLQSHIRQRGHVA